MGSFASIASYFNPGVENGFLSKMKPEQGYTIHKDEYPNWRSCGHFVTRYHLKRQMAL